METLKPVPRYSGALFCPIDPPSTPPFPNPQPSTIRITCVLKPAGETMPEKFQLRFVDVVCEWRLYEEPDVLSDWCKRGASVCALDVKDFAEAS